MSKKKNFFFKLLWPENLLRIFLERQFEECSCCSNQWQLSENTSYQQGIRHVKYHCKKKMQALPIVEREGMCHNTVHQSCCIWNCICKPVILTNVCCKEHWHTTSIRIEYCTSKVAWSDEYNFFLILTSRLCVCYYLG